MLKPLVEAGLYGVGRRIARRRLLYPENLFSGWLGLKARPFRRALLRKGILPRDLGDRSRTHVGSSGLSNDELCQLALYPACIEAEATPRELRELDEGEALREKWVRELEAQGAALAGLFDEYSPTEVALVQGYESRNALARLIALKRGLRVIAVENTALKDRLLWDDHSAITTNRNLAANYFWRHINSTDAREAKRYCEALIGRTKSSKSEEHASPEEQLEIGGSGRPVVLFLGQVYTDSSILYGIGRWGSPVRVMKELMRLAKRGDFTLVVKLHPKEMQGNAPITHHPYNQLTYRRLMEDPEVGEWVGDRDRIRIDHENRYDTYGLIRLADAVVTVNSQAGLESAIRDRPVVLCGHAFYGGLGFTHGAPEPHLLEPQMNHVLGIDPAHRREETDLARRFTRIFFEDYCLAKTEAVVAEAFARRLR